MHCTYTIPNVGIFTWSDTAWIGTNPDTGDEKTRIIVPSGSTGGGWVLTGSLSVRRDQISQSECRARIIGVLGAKCVDLWFPADASLSGSNVVSIPSYITGGATLTETHTTDLFISAEYLGRRVLRNTTNTGKRLHVATGIANSYIVAARPLSLAAAGSLIGGTDAGGSSSPYLQQTVGSGAV